MSTLPATRSDKNQLPVVQQIVSVMWPSFLTASAATIIFFTLFDPNELGMIGGFPAPDAHSVDTPSASSASGCSPRSVAP